MRKIFVLFFLLIAPAAQAGVPCSVPFNLTNGTIADASQVMANYNAILACLQNSAAASGSNNDITALTALSTPLAPALGGTSQFFGTTVSGTNAVVIGATTPTGFTLHAGYTVVWVPTAPNTAATTLQVGSVPATNLYRLTHLGPAPMVGGELLTGQLAAAMYDGTQFELISPQPLPYAVGQVFDYAGGTCPAGSLETTGNALVSQTTYPTLFAVLGTTWGAAAGGNFTIPDMRGRATFSRDSGGSARITVGAGANQGGNFDGTAVGNMGGQQNKVIVQGNLPSVGLPVNEHGGHAHGLSPQPASIATVLQSVSAAGNQYFQALNGPATTQNATSGITVGTGGSDNPVATLSPAAIVIKCIKA